MPSEHAYLSPSAAHRWLHCPGSVGWEAELPDTTSDAAREGTAAHALAEARLKADPELLRQAQQSEWYNAAMEGHIDTYVDYIHELRTPGDELLIEQRLEILPKCFGTADCLVISEGKLDVVDLKYGKGVRVDAENNPQCLLYAYGAWQALSWLYDIRDVTVHIVQPRLDHITSWHLTVDEMRQQVEGEEFQRHYQDAAHDVHEYHAGDHCRFCRAAPICRQRALHEVAKVAYALSEGGRDIGPTTVGYLLEVLPGFENWAKGIKDGALSAAIAGANIPGYKLVAGRGTRKITNPTEAETRLAEAGFDPAQYMELRGLTDLEKAVGKKELSQVLDGLIVKSDGRPTLVKNDDPRPAYSSAVEDFKEE